MSQFNSELLDGLAPQFSALHVPDRVAMQSAMLKSQIEGAEAYERLMVPALIISEWAPKVARAARVAPGQRVLDLACGTGVLSREAARLVGESGSVSGVDPNAGMLTVARRLAPRVDWQQGTAEDHAC